MSQDALLKKIAEMLEAFMHQKRAEERQQDDPAHDAGARWIPLRKWCDDLSISRRTAYRYIQRGIVEAKKLASGQWRVNSASFKGFGGDEELGSESPVPEDDPTPPTDYAAALKDMMATLEAI